ncbi:MAG TPA: hypothetical protein VMS18_16670 [Candidatus Binatia bacterium]|nr:hypothetical protein [Candidatus Binatia bacterium]
MNMQAVSHSQTRNLIKSRCRHAVAALFLVTACSFPALAQHSHDSQPGTADPQSKANALIRIVRQATERFKDVSVAEKEGYVLQFGCVSGPDSGAMGLHYVNGDLVNGGIIDPTRPQIVIYEPTPDGKLKLIGADFLVIASVWDAKNQGPPELMGQLFHYFESPNRFGLPAFYTLHVWAWKDNPNGAFVNWHPKVSCQLFNPVQ